jgi:hypothetical protein
MGWKQSNKSTGSSSLQVRGPLLGFTSISLMGALALLPCGCFGFMLATACFSRLIGED